MKKSTFFKTLLVAAGLLTGSNAWARTITYDFKTAAASGGITASSLTNSGTSAGTNNGTTIYYPSELTSELGNRLAFQFRTSGNKANTWAVEKGRNGLWVNAGTGSDEYFSICNLKAGDVVTVYVASGLIYFSTTSANCTYDNEGTPTTPAQWEALVSERTYTVKVDGKLDLQAKKYDSSRGHTTISKLVIETSDDELIETPPTATVTGASYGNRTVTITGYNTSSGNETATYYTLDGTTPTSSSILYSAPITISTTDDTDEDGTVVVKAISYKSGDTSIASDVTTLNVTGIGETLTLNAPTIIVSDFSANGSIYNPVYTWTASQSSVIGQPTPTITYTYTGVESTEGMTYTPTVAGTLAVTASATGYTSNTTELIVSSAQYIQTYYRDFTELGESDHLSTSYNNGYSINGTTCNFYTMNSDAVDGITLPSNARAACPENDASDVRCLYFRAGSGTITYNGHFPSGSYLKWTDINDAAAITSTNSKSYSQYGNVKTLALMVPSGSTVSKEITSAGYATLYSEGALDFSGVSGLTAYIITGYDNDPVLLLTPVNSVPAETGVLLAGTANTYNIPYVATSTTNVTSNKLDGVINSASKDAKSIYVLLDGDNGVGFYQNNNTFTVGAHTAYLPDNFASEAKVRFFGFGNDATGIKTIAVDAAENATIYNLSGQRVNAAYKGIVIKNGKKYLNK